MAATEAVSPNRGGKSSKSGVQGGGVGGASNDVINSNNSSTHQHRSQSEMIRIPLPTNASAFKSRLSRNPTMQKRGGRGSGRCVSGGAVDTHSCSLPPQLAHALIRHTDMSYVMRNYALDLCVMALLKHSTCNESAARFIKEHMDKKHGACWHVVVGQKFGLEVSHEAASILYAFFRNSTLAICLWKCS